MPQRMRKTSEPTAESHLEMLMPSKEPEKIEGHVTKECRTQIGNRHPVLQSALLRMYNCTFTSNVPDRSRWCPPPILSSDCPTWCPLNQTFQLSPGSDECTVIQGPALLRGPVRRTPHVTSRELSIASNVRVLRGATNNNLTQTTFDATVQIEGS